VLRATTDDRACAGRWLRCRAACAEIDETQALAGTLPKRGVLRAGERGGVPIPGFDLGNSPREFTARVQG